MYLSNITNGLWSPDDLTLLMTRLYILPQAQYVDPVSSIST